MRFENDGAERFYSVLNKDELSNLITAISKFPPDRAGIRLIGIVALNGLISSNGKIGKIVQRILGKQANPVRAVLFDKNPIRNWGLRWHQDRTIAVKQRIETEGYEPWSIKSGLQHVAPPIDLLAQMVTARIHLDKVDINNAPLLVAPGSHRLGRVSEAQMADVVTRCGTYACLAEAGDVWFYSTPILHASEKAKNPKHRRVLQVDFSAGTLPNGLEWLGV